MQRLNFIEQQDLMLIVKITQNIYKYNRKLAYLHLEGKKDSSEYNRYLDYLDMLVEGEQDKYNSCNLDDNMIKQWLLYLFLTDISVYREVNNYSRYDLSYYDKYDLDNSYFIDYFSRINSNLKVRQSFFDENNRMLYDNMEKIFVYFCQHKAKERKLFNKLNMVAYDACLMNMNLEQQMLKSKFAEISTLEVDKKAMEMARKNNSLMNLAFDKIECLMQFKDEYYQYYDRLIKSVEDECSLNAVLLFLSEQQIDIIKNIVSNNFNCYDSIISKSRIDECFSKVGEFRKKLVIN